MIIQCQTNSFRRELLQAVHNFQSDTFKLALYTSNAALGPKTTVYSSTDEVVAAGYTAGGRVLTGGVLFTTQSSDIVPGVVYYDWSDAVWSGAITARGALIYNASKDNKAVAVLNFGADKTSTTTFTVQMPAATADAALLRFTA